MRNASRWDERFIGYGYDKVSQITELHQAGYTFMVVPNVFIIHWDHGTPKWRNKGDLVRIVQWVTVLGARSSVDELFFFSERNRMEVPNDYSISEY